MTCTQVQIFDLERFYNLEKSVSQNQLYLEKIIYLVKAFQEAVMHFESKILNRFRHE